MLDHVSIGVRDVAASRRFYDPVLAALGYRCLFEGDGYAGYGSAQPQFWLNASEAPVPADDRSGLHFSFTASGKAAVDAFHAAALAAGGKDNGKPGPRTEYGPGYYAAFAKDLDGYRIEAHCELSA
jgi:catechol 2,3-dioxygenase-like lactoylglutathione lyase family enzyme